MRVVISARCGQRRERLRKPVRNLLDAREGREGDGLGTLGVSPHAGKREQDLLAVDGRLVLLARDLLPGPLGREPARLYVVGKLEVHEGRDQSAAAGVEHRVGDLHASLGVSRHHVGAGEVDRVGLGTKGVDAGVLEKASHDLPHNKAVGLAGDVGADAADAAHDHEHAHASLAGLGDLVDHVAVGEGVHLEEDLRGLVGSGALDLAVEAAHHERLEACRRHAQQLVGAAEISQREVAEERVAVRANGGVGRHEHEVRVELGGLLVEVARSQAGDAADAGVVMVGNLADLRVALEALGAVDYGAAGILQALCPGDVVLLVKAGAQLHEDGDVLACLGGGYEALAEVAALCHAVERDLDRDALVVRGGLAHKAKQRRHALVRVGEKDVVVLHLAAHGELGVDHGRGLGLEGREDNLGVGPVGDLCLEAIDVAQVERHAHVEDATLLKAKLLCDKRLPLAAKLAGDLEPHRLQPLAQLEDLLHVLAVVFLLLDALAIGVDVCVARDAQHCGLLGDVLAKAAVEEGAHDVLDEGVAEGPGA